MRILSLPIFALATCALLSACDTPARESTPPPASKTPAEPAPEPVAADDEPAGANFATPPEDDPPPAAEQPAASPELDKRIKEKFGERCRYERACEDMIGVDCGAAVDGPYYYVDKTSLETISTCGGACMGGRCTNCPPERWTCPTY